MLINILEQKLFKNCENFLIIKYFKSEIVWIEQFLFKARSFNFLAIQNLIL